MKKCMSPPTSEQLVNYENKSIHCQSFVHWDKDNNPPCASVPVVMQKAMRQQSSLTCRLMMSALQPIISCMMFFFLYSQFRAQEGQ